MTDIPPPDRQFKKNHPLYKHWQRMKRRCYDKKDISYPNYGGRGVKVCDEWIQDFWAFADHVGPKPGKNYSLDRIDNNGNYEPGNVKFSTKKEQNQNKRTTIKLTYKNKTMCLTEWARHLGKERSCLQARFDRGGSLEDVLSPDINDKCTHRWFYEGKWWTIGNLAKKFNLNPKTLLARYLRGWSVDKAILEPVKPWRCGSNANKE